MNLPTRKGKEAMENTKERMKTSEGMDIQQGADPRSEGTHKFSYTEKDVLNCYYGIILKLFVRS